MPIKRIDPKTTKIVIEVDESGLARPESLRAAQDSSTLGMLPGLAPSPQRRYRKRPVVSDIFINFFDLGQFTEDGGFSWLDYDFAVSPVVNWNFDFSTFTTGNTEDITLPQYAEMTNLFLTTPQAELKTKFRKFILTNGYKSGIDVYLGGEAFDFNKYFAVSSNGERNYIKTSHSETAVENSVWETDGLKVEKQTEQNFQIYCEMGFCNFRLGSNAKVTASAIFEAETVPFIIDKPVNFYLVPALTRERGFTANGATLRYLNHLYVFAPRQTWIDNLPDGEIIRGGVVSPFLTHFQTNNVSRSAVTDEIIERMRNRPLARLFNAESGEYENPLTFPLQAPSLNIQKNSFRTGNDFLTIPEGGLLAIAEKGGEFYYIWNTVKRANIQSGSPPRMQIGVS